MARFLLEDIARAGLTRSSCPKEDPSGSDDRRRREVNAVTPIPISRLVRRTHRLDVAERPDFFAMIDQQVSMVVDLAMALGEVLQGRELSLIHI